MIGTTNVGATESAIAGGSFTVTLNVEEKEKMGRLFDSPEKNCEFARVQKEEYEVISLFLKLTKDDPKVAEQCIAYLQAMELRSDLLRTAPPPDGPEETPTRCFGGFKMGHDLSSPSSPTWSVDGIPNEYFGPYALVCWFDQENDHMATPFCKTTHPDRCTYVTPVPIDHCMKYFETLSKDERRTNDDASFLKFKLPLFKELMGFRILGPSVAFSKDFQIRDPPVVSRCDRKLDQSKLDGLVAMIQKKANEACVVCKNGILRDQGIRCIGCKKMFHFKTFSTSQCGMYDMEKGYFCSNCVMNALRCELPPEEQTEERQYFTEKDFR